LSVNRSFDEVPQVAASGPASPATCRTPRPAVRS